MSYSNNFWDAVFECDWTYYVLDNGNILSCKPYNHASQWN